MAQDVEAMQEKPPNDCCKKLKDRNTVLVERCKKHVQYKKGLRECIKILEKEYDALEKKHGSLKKALEEINLQANVWKDEKEKEAGRRIDLEDEVSALQDEIQLLKQNGIFTSEVADEQLQERLAVAEKEIKQLNALLGQERERVALEKKNAELQKKKANEALEKVEMGNNKVSEVQKVVSALQDEVRLFKQKGNLTSEEADKQLQERLVVAEEEIKQLNMLLGQERQRVALEKKKADEALEKVEIGKNKVSEVQKVANAERKKADENRVLLEKLKKGNDDLKSVLALEKSKSEAAEKKVDAEKQKAIRERTRADSAMAKSEEQREIAEVNLKKATFEKDRADDLNRKLVEARNKAEAAEKKVEAEKQRAVRERKRANMAVAKTEEQRKLAETNLKMAMFEKARADDLNMKLEEARKLVEAQDLQHNAGTSVELTSNACAVMLKNDSQFSQLMKKVFLEKGDNILKEKTCTDSEKKKARKQRKDAEKHKRMAMEQKSRADHLSGELKSYKLKFEESQKELQEFISCRIGSNVPSKNSEVASETDTVKLLNKQLELERLLVKHAKKATKLEAFRNKLLHQELCNLKQEYRQFKQRLDILDKNFLLGQEGVDQLGKIGKREKICSDGCHSQLTSGTDSRMDPPYGGSNKKMLKSSVINSSSASFSDRTLVGSQERAMLSVITPANLAEDISNREPSIGRSHEKMTTRSSENGVAKADKTMKRRASCHEKKGVLDEKLNETSCGELSRPCKKRKTAEGITGNYHCNQDFDEMGADDYMKLLELDDASDEDSYQRAIATPLSPMLPVVGFLEADNSGILVSGSYQEGLPNVRDNPTSISRFHVIESKKNHTDLSSKSLVVSLLQTEEGPMDSSNNLDSLSSGEMRKLGMSDLSGSRNEKFSILRENVIESSDGGLPNYLVVAPDKKDTSSILRILQTIGSCMPHCSFVHSAEPFLRTILHTLLKAEALSIKEKACVFFSLILHEIYAVGLDSPTNVLSDNSVQILGSVTTHINTVFCDPVFRRIFMESCDMFELLAVLEDFLLQKKVLVCGEVSADSDILSTSKLNLIINGNEVILSEVVASARLLVVGASLLASLCSAIDHIGFVCEVSCNIIRMQKFEPLVMLAVLHTFAHICGSRYLTLQQYSLTMTLVKSAVLFLEKQTSGTNSTSLVPSEVDYPSKIWLCTNCLFLEDAIPMEDVALLLLEELQKKSCSQDSLALNNLTSPKVRSHEDDTEEGPGLREAFLLSSTSDENICDFIDVLSLVEVLASFMSWDWTADHLIRQICEYLESRLMDGSSAAIIVLLGQLGRLGADAGGYDDSGVKKLRGWLSAFVCESSFTKYSLSVQFALVTSLFSLTPIKLEDIIGGCTESHSIPASFIREWFFSLSDVQQSFFECSSKYR